jgi:hypothetical protein
MSIESCARKYKKGKDHWLAANNWPLISSYFIYIIVIGPVIRAVASEWAISFIIHMNGGTSLKEKTESKGTYDVPHS